MFGMGIIARKLRENGQPEESKRLTMRLVAELSNNEDPNDKLDILRGIANSGDAVAFDVIRPLLTSPIAAMRIGSVEAIRLMDHPEVDKNIANHVLSTTESDENVRVAAVESAAMRRPVGEILAAVISTAKSDPEEQVKKAARKVLFRWMSLVPKLRKVLDDIANEDLRASLAKSTK
jgi:hypothetical protein